MPQESYEQIRARLDEQAEPCPDVPAASCVYDTTKRFRVVAGRGVYEEVEYADTLKFAMLIAGEFQIHRPRLVIITQQHGRPLRWKAELNGPEVYLSQLYDDDGAPEDAGSRRLAALAGHIDKHAKIRAERNATKAAKPPGTAFNQVGVVCTTLSPPRPFGSIQEAAAWAGVSRQSMHNHLKGKSQSCGGFRFAHAVFLLNSPVAVIKAVAEEAMRLAKGGRRSDHQ